MPRQKLNICVQLFGEQPFNLLTWGKGWDSLFMCMKKENKREGKFLIHPCTLQSHHCTWHTLPLLSLTDLITVIRGNTHLLKLHFKAYDTCLMIDLCWANLSTLTSFPKAFLWFNTCLNYCCAEIKLFTHLYQVHNWFNLLNPGWKSSRKKKKLTKTAIIQELVKASLDFYLEILGSN